MSIVILYGDDDTTACQRMLGERLAVDRLDAEDIHDPNGNARPCQLFVRRERFGDGDARGDDEHAIALTLAEDLAPANLELLVGAVDDRRLGSAESQVAGTWMPHRQFGCAPRARR